MLPLICSLMKALELVIPKIQSNYEWVSKLNQMIIEGLKSMMTFILIRCLAAALI